MSDSVHTTEDLGAILNEEGGTPFTFRIAVSGPPQGDDPVKNEASIAIEIYDPPMCCQGGLCGPAIDPALLDVNEALLRIRNDQGVVVQRYLLQQQGQKFMENPAVLALLQEHGTEILPVTTVGGAVVKTKTFPSYQELSEWSSGSDGAPARGR